MAIDGIGKPPSIAPASSGVAVGSVSGTPSSFRVNRTETSATSEGDTLGRLRRGELTREQYLEARVEAAVKPLAGRLDAERLEFVRTTLRDQLENDPILVELVKQATHTIGAPTE
jgi:hypothetical protein